MIQAALLSNGTRLHLHHGPIDLVIGADGHRMAAFRAAHARMEGLLQGLVDELHLLRVPVSAGQARPQGAVAQRMFDAAAGFADCGFVTPMAAVAGSVADAVLAAMATARPRRAYVNNGGDIALHLSPGTRYKSAIADPAGRQLGQIDIAASAPTRGIASSGRHGRSHSLGIADVVTVLAPRAPAADIAATLIANAVDLGDHPAIRRRKAVELDENSDLGELPVVTDCGPLDAEEVDTALANGASLAQRMRAEGRITAALLSLQGRERIIGPISPNMGADRHGPLIATGSHQD